jgi:hypothetical protein
VAKAKPEQVWVHTGEWLAVCPLSSPGDPEETLYFPCGANAWPVNRRMLADNSATPVRGTGVILYANPQLSAEDHTHWFFYGEGPQVQAQLNAQLRSWGYSGMVHDLRTHPTPNPDPALCAQTPAMAG